MNVRWDAVDAAALARDGVAGRVLTRERKARARTNNASTLSPHVGRPHTAARTCVEEGRCGRRSRVVLASVADVKPAEVLLAQPGLDKPLIRLVTVTKRNSSPGRVRRKPLKPSRRKRRACRGTCGPPCAFPAHGLRVPSGARRFLRPLFFLGRPICKARA